MTVLITGVAGFIGMSCAAALLARGDAVVGIDNLNDYYDPALKKARLDRLAAIERFRFEKSDVADAAEVARIVGGLPDGSSVLHLAAQAGVRYSLENPGAYVETNVRGQLAVLEAVRHHGGIRHLTYASSSSVYGGNMKMPFAVEDRVDRPISLYARDQAFGRGDELVLRPSLRPAADRPCAISPSTGRGDGRTCRPTSSPGRS